MKTFKQFLIENKYYFTIDNAPNTGRIASNGILKSEDKNTYYMVTAENPNTALHLVLRNNREFFAKKGIKSKQITPHLYTAPPSQEERMKNTSYWKKDFE